MLSADSSFWHKLDALLSQPIIVDRPKGKPHPGFPDMVYPMDYGYLEDTSSGDGDGIDVWLGSLAGEKRIVGAIISFDHLKKDLEVKLLLNCSEAEIEIVLNFLTDNEMAAYLISRK